MIRRKAIFTALLATLEIGALRGQGLAPAPDAPPSQASGGLRVHSVSGFATYLSLPSQSLRSAGSTVLMDQTGFGGSATVGYTRFEERTGISLTYRSSYTMGLREYGTNIQSHSLDLNIRRSLTPKWTHTLGVSAGVNSIADSLFVPTSAANVAGIPATFDQLSSAMVSGSYTNGPLAAALTGAQPIESPAAWALYGSRILTSTAISNFTYSYSSRLQFHMTAGGSRSQPFKDERLSSPTHPDYLIAHTTSGRGDFGVSYSLSPRTQVGAEWSTARNVSNLLDAYTHTGNFTFARIMSRSWFVQLRAGAGATRPIRQTTAVSRSIRNTGGGGIGYRSYAHTVLFSLDRSIADIYGFGARTSLTASGAWNWNRPGNSWSMAANFSQQRLTGTASAGINTWRGTAGFIRRLGRTVALSTQYAYIGGPQFYGPAGATGSRHMIRTSLVWTPDGMNQ